MIGDDLLHLGFRRSQALAGLPQALDPFLEYIMGTRVTLPYRWVYCGLIVFGAVSKVDTVWAWGDLMNGLQIFPNVAGLIGLSGVAAAALRAEGRRS